MGTLSLKGPIAHRQVSVSNLGCLALLCTLYHQVPAMLYTYVLLQRHPARIAPVEAFDVLLSWNPERLRSSRSRWTSATTSATTTESSAETSVPHVSCARSDTPNT
jgi:hypothetical protein